MIVTRAATQAEPLMEALRAEGALPRAVPVVQIEPPADPAPLARAVAALAAAEYGAVLFTSQNAVGAVLAALTAQGLPPTAMQRARVFAVGPATARALTSAGVAVDGVARTYLGDALAPVVAADLGAARPRLLLPRAETAREELPAALDALGFPVDIVTAYVTRGASPDALDALVDDLLAGRVDAITLTSGSTASALLEALSDAVGEVRARAALARTALVSIGPRTTETAEALGLRVDATAAEHSTGGLVTALRAHFPARHAPSRN